MKTEFSSIDASLKSPSLLKDTVIVAVGSKDVRSFPKEESCRVTLNKVQEIPKLQEPVQKLAETLQRHCHKRLRGKTVTGGECSNSSSLSLLRPNTPGELALLVLAIIVLYQREFFFMTYTVPLFIQ